VSALAYSAIGVARYSSAVHCFERLTRIVEDGFATLRGLGYGTAADQPAGARPAGR
jgi:hypothetical protein